MNADLWLAHLVSIAIGVALQALGTYALWVALGAWVTLGLYTAGALAAVLLVLIVRRSAPC